MTHFTNWNEWIYILLWRLCYLYFFMEM